MEKATKDTDDINMKNQDDDSNLLIDTNDEWIYQKLLEKYKLLPDLICQVNKELALCKNIDYDLYVRSCSLETVEQISEHTEDSLKFWNKKLKELLEKQEKREIINKEESKIVSKEEWEIINKEESKITSKEEWEITSKEEWEIIETTNSQNQNKHSIWNFMNL